MHTVCDSLCSTLVGGRLEITRCDGDNLELEDGVWLAAWVLALGSVSELVESEEALEFGLEEVGAFVVLWAGFLGDLLFFVSFCAFTKFVLGELLLGVER
jgi:hypothetical protein